MNTSEHEMRNTLIVFLLLTSATLADETNSGIEPRETYLLLDQRLVSNVDNAVLKIGTVSKLSANPLFGEDLPWESQLSHMYANVIFDAGERTYKCWYYSHQTGWEKDVEPGRLAANQQNGHGNCATLYATSKDGIRWNKPKLEAYLHKGNPTNIVNWRDHGTGVFKDSRDTNPERRYKMFCKGGSPGGRLQVAFSPDGIHWTKLNDTKISTSGDTHNNAFWNPLAKEYVGITRAFSHGKMGYDLQGGIPWVGGFVVGQRVVARTTSKDFVNWSPPEIVFEYGHDQRQIYSMPTFYTNGVFLGLPVIYDNAGSYDESQAREKGFVRQEVTLELESELKNAGSSNRMWPGLSWSPDAKDWSWVGQRGEAVIPLSEDAGSHEWGCIFAANAPIMLEDEIRIYYSAEPGKHGWNPGHLCLATLRADGWAGYKAKDDSEAGIVETQPTLCNGKALSLAADADNGSVSVILIDAQGKTLATSEPVTGSKPFAPVNWNNGFKLSTHQGQKVRLKFTINNAKLYSFQFSD